MKNKILLFTIALCGMVACSEKNMPISSEEENSNVITCIPSSQNVLPQGGTFTVSITSQIAWSATVDKSWVSLSSNTGQGSAYVTISTTAGNQDTAKVLFTNGKNTSKLVIVRGEPEGKLPGKFTVAASTQVQFSSGNLQYNKNTGIWRFATHQYDIIGNETYITPVVDDGWIDRYGWGTGDNPTLSTEDGNDYLSFQEWGNNPISNGGNISKAWRTLERREWLYLFHGRQNASKLFGTGSIEGIKGVIILPDNCVMPSDVTFSSGKDKGMVWDSDTRGLYYNKSKDNFSHNIYSILEWRKLEDIGAVFLPADGEHGNYWSSTRYNAKNCENLSFNSWEIFPYDWSSPYLHYSVRLVR